MNKVTRDLLQAMRDSIEDAIGTHIYADDDPIPNDCPYSSLVAQADALLMTQRVYALVSSQGTACAETALRAHEFHDANKARIETQFCKGGADDPLPGSWQDVTDNEAINPD